MTRIKMKPSALHRLSAFMIGLVSLVLVVWNTRVEAETNPASRFATIDALVEDHTFAIDKSVYGQTLDRIFLGGHFYSSKPPMLSSIGAAVHWVLHQAFGWSLREPGRRQSIYWVTVLLMASSHLLLLVYAYRLTIGWDSRARVQLPTFGAIALGYVGLGYATTFNNHTPAAALCLASFYHAYMARQGDAKRRHDWLLAGLFAGLAPTIDLGAVFASVAIGVYLLVLNWRKCLRQFALAGLPPIIIHFALTYCVTGSLLPLYLRKEVYKYEGSYWLNPGGLDALHEPKTTYLFHMLLGHHGVLAMTPLFSLALYAIFKQLRKGGPLFREALLVGGVFVATVVFYTFTTNNYGGDCVDFRWLIVTMPLLFVFVGPWLASCRGDLATGLFALFFAVGHFNALDALRDPWLTSIWHQTVAPLSARQFR